MNNRQHGMSYIEVLMALLILGISALCFSAFSLHVIQASEQALLQTVAFVDASSQAEWLSVTEIQDAESLAHWNESVSHHLPSGQGEIVRTSGDALVVRVSWQAGVEGGWQCQSAAQSGRSCIERTVSVLR